MTTDYLKKILTARVYDVAVETPLEYAPSLSRRTDNKIYLKREDMQSVFSFKLRGAYNKMAHLTPAQLKRGVICASAGNHAQGVALSAARLGCRAVVVMPTTTPQVKIEAVKARGAEVVLPSRVFAGVRFSRFEKSGERVFVSDGEAFPLGIDLTASITPIELSGGYRFRAVGRTGSVVPYIGGGVGWHTYKESSQFAGTGEDIEDTFMGYHALGGAEVRLGRWFGIAGEAHWTSVPAAIGDDSSSAAAEFAEHDLGGFAVRVKFVVGR